MSWRGTLLLLFVAATALLLLLLPDRSHTRSTDEPLFGIDPSLAEKIIIAESGREITLLKNNGVWWLHSEINDRADPSLVHDLLQTAVGIVPLDTFHPKTSRIS